jgi:tetratricopeptide (TPR) repeat protein
MLTTKKWAVEQTAVLGLMVVLCGLSGCQPSGPTLARDGVRLLEQGKYERAIEKLVAARERLPGHAQLWNHLGLAYHGAYQLKDAINAYQQALRLDPNLAVARYNLGCLWLEQNEYAMAAEQLRSYTLLQPESADGWLRLATALLRDRKLDAAERSFAEVLKRAPTNIEALNSTGRSAPPWPRIPSMDRPC